MTRPTVPIDATFDDVMVLVAKELLLMGVNLPYKDIDADEWEEWLTTTHETDVTRLYSLRDSCLNLNRAMELLGEWERLHPAKAAP